MANFSFVKNTNGQIHGIWIQNTEHSKNTSVLVTYISMHKEQRGDVMKPTYDQLVKIIVSKNYRVVPNNFDDSGGCFLMFDEELAPGEVKKNSQKEGQSMDDDRLKEMLIKYSKGMVWKCPNCSAILEKKLDPVFNKLFGDITGTNSCKECGNSFSSKDVYSSKYDISLRELKSIAGDNLMQRGIGLLMDTARNKNFHPKPRIEAINVLQKVEGKSIINILKDLSKDQDQEVQKAVREAIELVNKKWWKIWK